MKLEVEMGSERSNGRLALPIPSVLHRKFHLLPTFLLPPYPLPLPPQKNVLQTPSRAEACLALKSSVAPSQ